MKVIPGTRPNYYGVLLLRCIPSIRIRFVAVVPYPLAQRLIRFAARTQAGPTHARLHFNFEVLP